MATDLGRAIGKGVLGALQMGVAFFLTLLTELFSTIHSILERVLELVQNEASIEAPLEAKGGKVESERSGHVNDGEPALPTAGREANRPVLERNAGAVEDVDEIAGVVVDDIAGPAEDGAEPEGAAVGGPLPPPYNCNLGIVVRRRRWYAVVKGVHPGIYPTWAEADRNVTGFRGQHHMSFRTRLDAERWMTRELRELGPRGDVLVDRERFFAHR